MLLAHLLTSVQLTVVQRRVTTRSLDLRRSKRFRILVDAENPHSRRKFAESYTANILADEQEAVKSLWLALAGIEGVSER